MGSPVSSCPRTAALSQAAPGQPGCRNGLVGNFDLKHNAQHSHLSHSMVFAGQPMPPHTRPKWKINPTKPSTQTCIRTKILCVSPLGCCWRKAELSLRAQVCTELPGTKSAQRSIAGKLVTLWPTSAFFPGAYLWSRGHWSQEAWVLIQASHQPAMELEQVPDLHQVSAPLPQGYQPLLPCRAIGRTSENMDEEVMTSFRSFYTSCLMKDW